MQRLYTYIFTRVYHRCRSVRVRCRNKQRRSNKLFRIFFFFLPPNNTHHYYYNYYYIPLFNPLRTLLSHTPRSVGRHPRGVRLRCTSSSAYIVIHDVIYCIRLAGGALVDGGRTRKSPGLLSLVMFFKLANAVAKEQKTRNTR